MSFLGPSAVSKMVGVAQASSLLSPSFSFCSSITLSQSCCVESGPFRQLLNDLPDLRKGQAYLDSVIMAIPSSLKLTSIPMDVVSSIPPSV